MTWWLATLATFVLRTLGGTIRLDTSNLRDLPDPLHGSLPPTTPIIYTFWHNQILAATLFFRQRGIVVMTSLSRDGDMIAEVIQRFGFGAARGSATRGSVAALKAMVKAIRRGADAAFTIDGPKGPRYRAKDGAAMLASLSGAPIQPVCIVTKHYWTLKTWDGFRIPKPFTVGRVFYGEPIWVRRGATDEEIAAATARLQTALDTLLRQWEAS
ncbi:MAG: lysophospholipid acyltransferase family protein [Chloracidobacterium sp.]|uniref:Lysophospholipid acyltransferase family protein n=1 Tax=Chloracidobacterium validum TaxID=2821543 RepID=A0ABX8B9D2_9BACT|nr:lysophospholipid acyltransferase family protein [Chloracidobacterium validum]QUW02661.1 lysophospholipid acyltransferase family protein [Chloracidobacterium validum]